MSVKRGLVALLSFWSLGCATRTREPNRNDDAPASRWHYEIAVDEALGMLDAKVCFEGVMPRELRPGMDEAASRLRHARWLGPGAVRRLPVESGRIQIGRDERDGCVGYAVSLAEGGSLHAAVRRVGSDVVASPNAWLWRPERRTIDATATLRLQLPPGLSALLPWPVEGERRQLDASAFRFDSYAAIGRFDVVRSEVDGVAIEAALLDGTLAIGADAALAWLRGAVRVAAGSDGKFPAQRLSALVVPAGDHEEPVPFGMVARGGEPSVLLLVSETAREAALASDWVLPHELSHLLLPFVEREQAWLSEGFATYYQEVLRVRAGVLSEREGMQSLASSLRDAAAGDGDASVPAESARMHATQRYRKVYWGGAAFWLAADVELRRRTQGHRTLDALLHTLRAEGGHDVWTADALIARLDALAGSPVFSQGRDDALARPFPTFEPTLEALGVRGSADAIELDDAAPLAEIRRALLAPPSKH